MGTGDTAIRIGNGKQMCLVRPTKNKQSRKVCSPQTKPTYTSISKAQFRGEHRNCRSYRHFHLVRIPGQPEQIRTLLEVMTMNSKYHAKNTFSTICTPLIRTIHATRREVRKLIINSIRLGAQRPIVRRSARFVWPTRGCRGIPSC